MLFSEQMCKLHLQIQLNDTLSTLPQLGIHCHFLVDSLGESFWYISASFWEEPVCDIRLGLLFI